MAILPCPECGREISSAAMACPGCGHPVRGQPAIRDVKSPGLAAVLSALWSGLGQIYNGEIGKGVGIAICYVISILLIGAIIGIVSTPIIWIWGMVDAYRTAERLNAGNP
jgi:TM2 domain-containing membrane protein YozV